MGSDSGSSQPHQGDRSWYFLAHLTTEVWESLYTLNWPRPGPDTSSAKEPSYQTGFCTMAVGPSQTLGFVCSHPRPSPGAPGLHGLDMPPLCPPEPHPPVRPGPGPPRHRNGGSWRWAFSQLLASSLLRVCLLRGGGGSCDGDHEPCAQMSDAQLCRLYCPLGVPPSTTSHLGVDAQGVLHSGVSPPETLSLCVLHCGVRQTPCCGSLRGRGAPGSDTCGLSTCSSHTGGDRRH